MSLAKKWIRGLRRTYSNKKTQSDVCQHPASASVCERIFLVSYPRSGSNFFQEVMKTKFHISSRSLYGDNPQDSTIRNLKSHAISYEYLKDECSFILGDQSSPNRIIVLFRDPRDVMISFFNRLDFFPEKISSAFW